MDRHDRETERAIAVADAQASADEQVFELVLERVRECAAKRGKYDEEWSPGDWLLIIERVLGEAKLDWTTKHPQDYSMVLDRLLSMMAVCMTAYQFTNMRDNRLANEQLERDRI